MQKSFLKWGGSCNYILKFSIYTIEFSNLCKSWNWTPNLTFVKITKRKRKLQRWSDLRVLKCYKQHWDVVIHLDSNLCLVYSLMWQPWTIHLNFNHVLHSQTKHVELDIYFVHKILSYNISLLFVKHNNLQTSLRSHCYRLIFCAFDPSFMFVCIEAFTWGEVSNKQVHVLLIGCHFIFSLLMCLQTTPNFMHPTKSPIIVCHVAKFSYFFLQIFNYFYVYYKDEMHKDRCILKCTQILFINYYII